MKIRIIIYLIILLLGIGIFTYSTKPKWSPWYCGQYSGFHSYAWGGGSEKCSQAGCKIKKLKEIDDPNDFDDEGFSYKCINK